MNLLKLVGFSLITPVWLGCSLVLVAQNKSVEDSADAGEIVGDLVDQLEGLPNVVLIVADDMGWGDFGVHGNAVIDTPHLDKMAKNGVSWENFYVSPVGSLTRASLMTGRYNQRTKCMDTYLGRSLMATDEVTIAEALSGAGYATGIFGKWHLGDNYPLRASDQGFSYSLVHRGGGLAQPSDALSNDDRFRDVVLYRNNAEVQTKGYCTDVYFDEAIQFIDESRKFEQPFFAYITPNTIAGGDDAVPEDLLDYYKKKDLAKLVDGDEQELSQLQKTAARVTHVDENVGRLFKVLEDGGMLENTLVIFVNDNGPEHTRFNGDFKGGKKSVYDGGVRSPLWMHWPSKLKAGTKIKTHNAAHIDIMPTIMDACEMGIPAAFEFDGRSLLSKSTNVDAELAIRPIVIQAHRGATLLKNRQFMVREGDWKLVCESGFEIEDLQKEGKIELYNVTNDPSESSNVAGEHAEEVKRLTDVYNTWFEDVTRTRLTDRGTPYILIDRRYENPVVLTWQDRISKDWSIEEQGFWKLFFQGESMIDVRVSGVPAKYKHDLNGYHVVLQVGKTEYKSSAVGEDALAVFQALQVPKGKTTIQAKYVSSEGVEVPAYQVRVIHR